MSSWRELLLALVLAGVLSAAPVSGGMAAHAATSPDIAAALAKEAPAVPAEKDRVGYYGYGTVPTPEQIAGWDIAVRPDGKGLPPGSGTAAHGADVYATQCAPCHGTFGEGAGRFPKLASEAKLTGDNPTKAVGNYWPYATTLWDYVNRAMPFPSPHTLKPDDIYAITAYILNLNNIVPDNFVADRNSLPEVKMPNRNGFLWADPRPDTSDKECMANCLPASAVRIISTAAGKGLTPRTIGPLDEMKPK